MSLGAIDFGLIVDGAVVMIENIIRRKAALGRSGRDHARASCGTRRREVARPIAFAVGIIIMVYVPILTLGRASRGRCSARWRYTVIFALVGSLVLSLTLIPVLASFFLRGRDRRARDRPAALVRGGSTRRCSTGRWRVPSRPWRRRRRCSSPRSR